MAEDKKKAWAVVEIAKKQYFVIEHQPVTVQKLDQTEGEIVFDKVLVTVRDEDVKVGKPYISGAKVVAKIEGQEKGPKVLTYKWKRRKKARKLRGHRQNYTNLKISSIS